MAHWGSLCLIVVWGSLWVVDSLWTHWGRLAHWEPLRVVERHLLVVVAHWGSLWLLGAIEGRWETFGGRWGSLGVVGRHLLVVVAH